MKSQLKPQKKDGEEKCASHCGVETFPVLIVSLLI